MLTTLLELFGLACLVAFAVVVSLAWPPAALLALGVAALFVAWRVS